MPELPEVETIKRELEPHIIGKKITAVTVYDARIVYPLSASAFQGGITGQRIENLRRRGKYLLFQLSNSSHLVVHLRMSGALLLNPSGPLPHTRLVLHFDDGSELVLTDRRRLGIVLLIDSEKPVEDRLGPEPLEPRFTVEEFANRLHRRRAPIKAVLLDQKVIAGIGNMYADEALFQARIHPLHPAGDLSPEEIQRLYNAIREILCSAIDNKGASVDTYQRPGGELGTAHFSFNVAHCRGEPCHICGTPIQRLAIRNRGSYFCPNCQKY